MRQRGLVTYEAVVGEVDHVDVVFSLTDWGEERLAPLADLGQAETLDD